MVYDIFTFIILFRLTTFLFFFAFVVVMPVLITNLLVGLAVDDIKTVQDNAVLKRLAMQVKSDLISFHGVSY